MTERLRAFDQLLQAVPNLLVSDDRRGRDTPEVRRTGLAQSLPTAFPEKTPAGTKNFANGHADRQVNRLK